MSACCPVMLKLDGKRCVVIGGGWGTEKRVQDLLNAGASVTLISPVASEAIEHPANDARIRWEARDYRRGDLEGAFLVVARPQDHARNPDIWAEAEARGIPVNAIDDSPHWTFYFPAIHRQGDLVVAVSTAGKSPALATSIRDRVAGEIGSEYADFRELLGNLRPEVIRCFPRFRQWRTVWHRLLDSIAVEHLKAGESEAAQEAIRAVLEGGQSL